MLQDGRRASNLEGVNELHLRNRNGPQVFTKPEQSWNDFIISSLIASAIIAIAIAF